MPMRTYWFIFYDDQLLLWHDEAGERIPEGPVAPLVIDHWIEATFDDGTTGRVAMVDAPEAEAPYRFVGLRASWSILSAEWYAKAGKARQLAYWDQHSRFCPACGTATDQAGPIVKRCPRSFSPFPTLAKNAWPWENFFWLFPTISQETCEGKYRQIQLEQALFEDHAKVILISLLKDTNTSRRLRAIERSQKGSYFPTGSKREAFVRSGSGLSRCEAQYGLAPLQPFASSHYRFSSRCSCSQLQLIFH